jgi:PDDEXK-like domain of unknown function (DUF3799)
MTLIDKPGIYRDFPVNSYFSDPCPTPSFTQGIAKLLLARSPLHAWYAHPRLNPDHEADDDTKFDIGNICHSLMIGRGKDLVVLGFDDWRTKSAKEAREGAAKVGKLAVLGKHYVRAEKIVKAGREQLELRRFGHLFRDGDGEVVVAWKEPNVGWCRQMIDWLTPNTLFFADYKTTEMSAAPHNLGRMLVTAGWDVQAAMAERGLDAVIGIGSRGYLFVVQEVQAPYCLSVVEMSESIMTMGRKKLAAAMSIWARCMKENRWPGYPLDTVVPEYPGWAEAEWLTREEQEFSAPADNVLMAG